MSDVLRYFLAYCVLLNAEKLLEESIRNMYQGMHGLGRKMSPAKKDLGIRLPASLLMGCESWQVTSPH